MSRDDRFERARDRTAARIAAEQSNGRPLGGVLRDEGGRPIGTPGKPLTGTEIAAAAAAKTRQTERRDREPPRDVRPSALPPPRAPAGTTISQDDIGRTRMLVEPEVVREYIVSGEAAHIEEQCRKEDAAAIASARAELEARK